MGPIRGVLLDKDGTLFDFRTQWLAAYRGAARELALAAGAGPQLAGVLLRRAGYDPDHDRFSDDSPLLWGTTLDQIEVLSGHPELAGVAGRAAIVLRHLEDDARYPPVPVGDLSGLFGRLRARGLRLGLATMDSTAQAEAQLDRFGLRPLLDFVTGWDGGFGVKPGPGMVRGFCAAVGLRPAEVLVVGDTRADLRMARAAGAGLAVAVLTGGTPRSVLEGLADRVLDDLGALESLLPG
jgi:phosphoglycolate phosphatase